MIDRKRHRRIAPLLAALIALGAPVAGCGADAPTPRAAAETGALAPAGRPAAGNPARGAESEAARGPLVAFLGDSLTAGYGLPPESAYPALIERTLREEGHPIRAVNAGVSGDTSAGGLSRLPRLLDQGPDVLVVALGGNDGLRGLPAASLRENLERIVKDARDRGVPVLLLGLRMPPNYGPEFTAEFERAYADVAHDLDVPLVPFMLEGVAGDPELMQGDGLHPNAKGQRIVAATVLAAVRPLLEARP